MMSPEKGGLPARGGEGLAQVPALSWDLRVAVARAAEGARGSHLGKTAAMHEEAEAAWSALERACRPVVAEEWQAFLAPLRASVANPPSLQELPALAQVMAFAHDLMPVCLLTLDNQRAAMRRFEFWPRARDIEVWLGGERDQLRRDLAALQIVLLSEEFRPHPKLKIVGK